MTSATGSPRRKKPEFRENGGQSNGGQSGRGLRPRGETLDIVLGLLNRAAGNPAVAAVAAPTGADYNRRARVVLLPIGWLAESILFSQCREPMGGRP
jgi:hypothetical protein